MPKLKPRPLIPIDDEDATITASALADLAALPYTDGE